MGQLADSWVSPTDVNRDQLAASIPQYPYDPTRAQQLLTQAGWVRGPSGALTHQSSGEVFQVQARADVDVDSEKLMAIVGNSWTQLGAQVSLTALTPALKNDNEFRAKFSGAHGRAAPGLPSLSQLHSKFQASADTRWIGGRSGYNNPRADPLLERHPITIESAAQLALEKELLQEVIGDLALMPMYWPVEPNLFVRGVSGVKSRDGWNVHEWTKQ
jgi:peptide/nickel transport system substrate-binding protein